MISILFVLLSNLFSLVDFFVVVILVFYRYLSRLGTPSLKPGQDKLERLVTVQLGEA